MWTEVKTIVNFITHINLMCFIIIWSKGITCPSHTILPLLRKEIKDSLLSKYWSNEKVYLPNVLPIWILTGWFRKVSSIISILLYQF